MSSIVSLVLLFVAVDDVELKATDGSTRTARLSAISDAGVTIEENAGQTQVDAAKLARVTRTSLPIPLLDTSPSFAVALRGGSMVPAKEVTFSDRRLNLKTQRDGTVQTVPLASLAFIRLKSADRRVDSTWEKMITAKRETCSLVIRRTKRIEPEFEGEPPLPAQLSLDELEGRLLEITANQIEFEIDGESLKVDREKVEGVLFPVQSDESLAETKCQVELTGGTSLRVQELKQVEGDLRIKTTSGVDWMVASKDWVSVDYSAGNTYYLADQEPTSVEWSPFLESSQSGERLAKLMAPRKTHDSQRDAQLGSKPLGLRLTTRTLVSYRVPKGAVRFVTRVTLDPASQKQGTAVLRAKVDGRSIGEWTLNKEQSEVDVALDLGSSPRSFEFEVDHGPIRELGNAVILQSARFVK